MGAAEYESPLIIHSCLEYNPAKGEQWVEREYLAIVEKAKDQEAEICWVDETCISSDFHHCRGDSPSRQRPVTRLNGKREFINMVSAIANQGKVLF